MKKIRGEIILIDTQKYEKELLNVSLDRLHYEIRIKYLNNIEDALDYLKISQEEIFLIISNFHLAKQREGLNLIKSITENPKLREKSIPFLFTSDSPTREEINEAYKFNIQGFFKKSDNIERMSDILEIIIKYWLVNKHPTESNSNHSKRLQNNTLQN